MISKLLLLFHTVRHLKASQIYWQLFYRLRAKQSVKSQILALEYEYLSFSALLPVANKYSDKNTFTFLNISKSFGTDIHWDEAEFGKLWTYNLEYFDYLFQDDLPNAEKLRLLHSFYDYSAKNNRKLEPYPVSLRVINSLKFLSCNALAEEKLHSFIYQEVQFLEKNLEYHILGNHLLENCFALLLAGAYFKNKKWQEKGRKLLQEQLTEQILEDGAHFELSPMYHQIILFRLLELIDWYGNYAEREDGFLAFLKNKAALMRCWLENISFRSGEIPLFSDAATGITYSTQNLLGYAELLKLETLRLPLGSSGYRSFSNETYEVKVDLGPVGATYQPGHAHADALSFVMQYQGQALFVEAGTSTYQIGTQRSYERSTRAHNTVEVGEKNQSQVWSGFRVGKRATTKIVQEAGEYLKAQHDGYMETAGICTREFIFERDNLLISDYLEQKVAATAYFHLAYGMNIAAKNSNSVVLTNGVVIEFDAAATVSIESSKYAVEWNKYLESKTIKVDFIQFLETKIIVR